MKLILDALFGFYHIVISPLLGRNCRYAPSCSLYTRQAIEIHGLLKGSFLGLKRISRCHPWGGHGFDPVPGSPQALSDEDCCRKDEFSSENYSDSDTPSEDKP